MWQVKPKLGNDMEVRIRTGKAINFWKSSGGKEEESRLRKLDTPIEMCGKNYAEEKSFPCLTRAEFERRKGYFETEDRGKGLRERRSKWSKSEEKRKWSGSFWRRFRSLESLSSSLECQRKELEMSRKLREIHEMVQKMEKLIEMKERTKTTGKAFSEWRNKARAPKAGNKWAPEPPEFEARCNLNRKLVPIQFSTSFVTELGSNRKSFSEKILFKSVFIPSGEEEEEKGRIFRSTLQVLCRPEEEFRKSFVFL